MSAPRMAWSLRGRLRVAVLSAAALLTVTLVVAVVAFGQLVRYQDTVTRLLFTAVVDLQDLQSEIVDAEAALRAFALSGDEDMLAGYAQLPYGRADDVRSVIGEVLPDDARLHAHFDQLAGAVDAWRVEHAEPVVAATRDGASVAADWDATGVERYSEVRLELDETLEALVEYRNETAATMRDWQRILVGSVVALSGLGVASGVMLWRYLRRWVTEPLDDLAVSSRAVAQGDLDSPVVGGGPREIVMLADDVESMRRRLVAEIATAEQAQAELRASNRDLEQFAYVASHDLQEPLRKVASFTQLLERRYGDQLDERGHQYIAFASDGARRMQRLIQDLLAFSRLGRVEEDPAPVVVGDCLAEALDNLSELLEETGAVVTSDPLPEVVGHAGLITQLLQNLVGNAVKFRRPDMAPRVHVTAERVGEDWEFRCSDNGIGIEPRHAERVFAIFQRLHAKDAYSGTGIGLAMCKRIVEYHGGRIWILHQDPSEGTTVCWTLPAQPQRWLVRVDRTAEAPADPRIDGGDAPRGPEQEKVQT
ncbi:sensor histidine kinase [Georgenia wutianyii]|nr:ATP-binding protein [Georgenia wutianyii]